MSIWDRSTYSRRTCLRSAWDRLQEILLPQEGRVAFGESADGAEERLMPC